MIIAVDGPAASGKGTLSKGLALHYNLPYLDTGLLYRGVGFTLLQEKPDELDYKKTAIKIANSIDLKNLDSDALGIPEVAMEAAKVAKIPEVREALKQFQVNFATQKGGAILDGRDIGTKICPNADVKLFIVAKPEIRANRRYLQLLAKGLEANEQEILGQIIARDKSDKENKAGNFYKASDAHLLDSTKLDIESSLREAIAIVDRVMAEKSE